jgi:glycosyltransferase involved in cell wall biosynthesis
VDGGRPGLPAVSVVAPTRDRATRLRGLLRALSEQRLARDRFEVIVVDDGSRDETPVVLSEAAGAGPLALTVVRRERAGGPAAARNAGWRRARAPLVAFVDDDCEPSPAWLEAMLAAAAAHPGAIIQGPTTPIPRETGALGPFARTRRIEAPGPWFQTCNILYPRALLDRLGGFDERFPDALGEDTDLAWRAIEAGAGTAFAPEAGVHHAVERLGPLGVLRTAMRGPDAVYVFRRHPRLRAEALRFGVLRNPALWRLALALAGFSLARRAPAACLLSLPYARNLLRRCRSDRAGVWLIPFYLLQDVLSAYTSLRGSARHRTLVL